MLLGLQGFHCSTVVKKRWEEVTFFNFLCFILGFFLLLSYNHDPSLKHSVCKWCLCFGSINIPPSPHHLPAFLFQCRCGSDRHLHRAQQHFGEGESRRSPGRLSDGQESAHAETTHGSDCGRWQAGKYQISCGGGERERERERKKEQILGIS